MQYRRLGDSGTRVSVLGLGGWTTFGGSVKDQESVSAIVRAAFDAGVNLFDIADVYARGDAEVAMGRALAEFPRPRLLITSKVFWPMSDDVNDRGLSRKHIRESVEASLRRIGTDYLDIYFCHRFDPDCALEETVRAMDDLVRQGKVLYWGTSEWSGAQLHQAHALADRRSLQGPSVEQPQFNLLERKRFETDVRAAAKAHGMGLVTWSPLASGLLSGKYDHGLPEGTRLARIDWLRDQIATEAHRERVRRLKAVADRLGCTRAQLALAWTAAQEGVSSVLTGCTSLAQLQENLGSLKVELDSTALSRIDTIFPTG
ncbi:MAG: aldo/keto reductase [Planctomycetes bacterium]|nr:aldo/keto reductase [Planctomycetota bacterium]